MQVKVADFGLARALEAAGSLTGGLGTYQVCHAQQSRNTHLSAYLTVLVPQYMSPEVLARQQYSQKADVYSMAIVMCECVSRQVCAPAHDSSVPSSSSSCNAPRMYAYL